VFFTPTHAPHQRKQALYVPRFLIYLGIGTIGAGLAWTWFAYHQHKTDAADEVRKQEEDHLREKNQASEAEFLNQNEAFPQKFINRMKEDKYRFLTNVRKDTFVERPKPIHDFLKSRLIPGTIQYREFQFIVR
jgi:hypothetical protein